MRGPYVVVHVSGTGKVCAVVVGPLHVAAVPAVVVARGGIGNEPIPLRRDERRVLGPVPDLLGRFDISVVAGEPAQPRGELEESAVGDGVAQRVAGLPGVDLPGDATIALVCVPAADLHGEDGAGQGSPRRLALDLWETSLGGGDGSETPEHLVIVTLDEFSWVWSAYEIVLRDIEIFSPAIDCSWSQSSCSSRRPETSGRARQHHCAYRSQTHARIASWS